MKKQIIQATKPLLNKLGFSLLRGRDLEQMEHKSALYEKLIHQSTQSGDATSKFGVSFIIFSKDRALQLDGLLQSMQLHVKGDFTNHILYQASDANHDKAYQEAADELQSEHTISWTKESNFAEDLAAILSSIETEFVCFLVDDIVFIRELNLLSLDIDTLRRGILSLRLGRGIHFCYTKQAKMRQPTLHASDEPSGLFQFNWNEGDYDWAYPLSVDGHIFPAQELKVAAAHLSFKAPNTFEKALQILNPLYRKRTGHCFESPKLVNIPMNRVQSEHENISDDISPGYLLAKWQEGMTLDSKALANISTKSVHEEISVCFCKRRNQI